MAKLTLNVDENVVARAKRYAARHETTVSRLVEQLLAALVRRPRKGEKDLPLILARLRAELKGSSADPATYRRYVERKYR